MRKMKKRYLFPADYMADPSVHVFEDRVYIYPSHDWESANVENDNGDQYIMKDYHVLSTDDVMNGEVIDHGKVIGLEDIAWAGFTAMNATNSDTACVARILE